VRGKEEKKEARGGDRKCTIPFIFSMLSTFFCVAVTLILLNYIEFNITWMCCHISEARVRRRGSGGRNSKKYCD
jgi:hypothetical protein